MLKVDSKYPFGSFGALDFSRGLNDVLSTLEKYSQKVDKIRSYPTIEMIEDEKTFDIFVELPGVTIEEVNVEVKDSILSIEVNQAETKRGQFKFRKEYIVPESLDASGTAAVLKNGLLTVTLRKNVKKENKIKINVKE